jgi:hypothetical protein
MYRSTYFRPRHWMEVNWASRPCRFTPGERAPGTHWIGGLGGRQNLSGRCVAEKNLAPTGTRTPTSSAVQPVAIPTELSRALHIYGYVGFEVFTAVVMKSSIFWDITPCSPLIFNQRFRGTYCLILRPWRWRRYVQPKRRLTFNSLDGVMPQKMVLFIVMVVANWVWFVCGVWRCSESAGMVIIHHE